MKITKAQAKALRKCAQPGGHGYGEHSGIRERTIAVLKRLGLVETGTIRGSRKTFRAAWTKDHILVCPYCREVMKVKDMEETSLGESLDRSVDAGETGESYCLSCEREVFVNCDMHVWYTIHKMEDWG